MNRLLLPALLSLVAVPGNRVVAATAPPTMRLTGPSPQVGGDGQTTVELRIDVVPPALLRSLTDLVITASAGVIGDVRDRGDGGLVVNFVPPRVGASLDIDIDVSARLGDRRLRARHRLQATPTDDQVAPLVSSGSLALRAPSRVRLGRDQRVEVRLRRLDSALPRLLVNAGWISQPVPADADTLTATYTAPLEKFPQVLLIAATDGRGALLDWLAVPLMGQAQITTVSEPDSEVRVQVGDTVFGPVRADARGRSTLPIVVPPGIEVATTIARDRQGGVERGEVSLEVPAFDRLLSLCDDDAQTLTVLAVDRDGRPDAQAQLKLTTNQGTLSAPSLRAPGVYDATLSLPAAVALGERLTMAAQVPEGSLRPATCEMVVHAGPPARVQLTLEPSVYVSGSGTSAAVTVDLLDRAGRPAAAELALETELGEVLVARPIEAGRYRAEWKLPDGFQGKRKAFVRARIGGSALTAEAPLSLAPGRARRLVVEAPQADLTADGEAAMTLSARLYDSADNVIEDATLETHAAGHVSAFTYNPTAGAYLATYRAPRAGEDGTDVIAVRHPATDLASRVSVALKRPAPRFALGVRGGYFTNFGSIGSPMIAGDFTWRLPTSWRGPFVGAELGYVLTDTTQRTLGDDALRATVRLFPVLARLGWEHAVASHLTLCAGVTGGATVVDRSTTSRLSGQSRATSAHGTAGGFLGAQVATGPGQLVLETGYRVVEVNTADLEGNAGGLVVSVGYRLAL